MRERKRSSDPLWEHAIIEGKQKVKCKFCDKVITGGITRFRYHLAQVSGCNVSPCMNAPFEIREQAFAALKGKKKTKRASSSRLDVASFSEDAGPSDPAQNKKKEEVDLAIVRMLENNHFIYGMMTTVEFRDICRAIASHGPGYEPPDIEMIGKLIYHKLKKGPELEKYKKDVIKSCKSSYGCSLALLNVDNYEDCQVNVALVFSSVGAVALNLSYNWWDEMEEDSDAVKEVLIANCARCLTEVDPSNVVHCIIQIDSDECHDTYWYTNTLESIFPQITFSWEARKYLALMEDSFAGPLDTKAYSIREFCQSLPLEIKSWMTQHINWGENNEGCFKTLLTIIRQEMGFRDLVDSIHWAAYDLCNSTEGSEIRDFILDQDSTFWTLGKRLCAILEPLMKLDEESEYDARFVGLIFKLWDFLEREKLTIYDSRLPIWTEEGKDETLYATVAFLNPYLSGCGYEIQKKTYLEDIIGVLISDEEKKKIIRQEIEAYESKDLKYFESDAFEVSDVHDHPKKWWEHFGKKVPQLQELAMKILAQTFSTLPFVNEGNVLEDVDPIKFSNRLNFEAKGSEWLHDLLCIMLNEKFMNLSKKGSGSCSLKELMKSYLE